MTNFFIIDAEGRKHGPYTVPHLQTLVVQGYVLPDTALETESGQKGQAKQITALFPPIPEAPPATSDKPLLIKNPRTRIVVCCGLGVACLLLLVWMGAMLLPKEKPASYYNREYYGLAPLPANTVPTPTEADRPEPPMIKTVMVYAPIEKTASHGTIVEVWADGRMLDSKASRYGTEAFRVSVPAGTTTLEGRVKYQNGFGAVLSETRGTLRSGTSINDSTLYIDTH